MGANLRKLGDFEEVLEYYEDMLEIAQKMNTKTDFLYEDPKIGPAYNRAIVNNMTISIAQNFEIIEEYNFSNMDEAILEELEYFCKKYEFPQFKQWFNDVMEKNSLSPFDVLKQIRNALLHGDYEIEVNESKKCKIYEFEDGRPSAINLKKGAKLNLNGKYIEATLEFPQIPYCIENFFEDVRLHRVPPKNIEFVLANYKYIEIQNHEELSKFKKKYRVYEIVPIGTTEDGNKGEIIDELSKIIIRDYPGSQKKFDKLLPTLKEKLELCENVSGKNQFKLNPLNKEKMKERKKLLSSYIEFIGYKSWDRLWNESLRVKTLVYSDLFESTFGQVSFSGISNRCFNVVRNIYISKLEGKEWKKNPELVEELKIVLYETPVVYANLMLDMLNYSCGYVKENNSDEGSNLFNFHNMKGLEGIVPTIDRHISIKKGISTEVIKTSLNRQIEGLESQKRNIEESIRRMNRRIDVRNPKKSEIEENKKKEEDRISEITDKIEELKIRKEQYGDTYDDYSEFFRHMRNSIAHGRYTIDYSKALDSRNFSKIKYTFRDYDKDDKVNPSFEISLTTDQIFDIINSFKDKVISQTMLEGTYSNIKNTEIKEVIDFEKIGEERKATVKDLHNSGFIQEEDKVDSFDIEETLEKKKTVGEKEYEDK